jgi:hypothetical protein
MPPREVPFRVVEQVRRLRGRTAGGARPPGSVRRRDTGLGALIRDWATEPAVPRFWQDRAGAVADGAVHVFGVRCPLSSAGVPDWNVDPRTGHRWPDRYCFDIPLHRDGVDVKHVWEVHRLQYLLPVAAHAAATGDRDAADLCGRHLQRWLDDNPAHRGVAWRSGIELAVRSLSMVLLLELVAGPGEPWQRLEAAVARSVWEHAEWIARFPSRYSSANNHRIAELAGLLVLAAAYPDARLTERVSAWWRELDEEVRRQIHPDGVSAEQSTAYGAHVVEWLAVCARIGPQLGQRFSPESRRRILAAAAFLTTVTDEAGHLVQIGDDDESRLLTAARPATDYPQAVVGLVERTLRAVVGPARPGLSCFVRGGYTVARQQAPGGEALWVLDHGPLGFGHLAAHAHADTLAVYLHYRGRPVFVNAGTFLYQGSTEWRNRLRSTALHNTVSVEGADSSMMTGAFNWHPRRRANGRLIDVRSPVTGAADAGLRVTAEHDGYLADHGVIHRRTLTATGPGRFRLSDGVAGTGRPGRPADTGRPAGTWSLLVAEGLRVRETARGWLVCDGDLALVRLEAPAGWSRETARGRAEPALGWYAPAFGRLVPTAQLLLRGRLDPGRSLDVDITLLAASDDPATSHGGRR